MRSITFDESTVMREFARIAGEQGLIKTAQIPPAPQGLQPAKPQPKPMDQFKGILDTVKQTMTGDPGQSQQLKDVVNKVLPSGQSADDDADDGMAKLQQLIAELSKNPDLLNKSPDLKAMVDKVKATLPTTTMEPKTLPEAASPTTQSSSPTATPERKDIPDMPLGQKTEMPLPKISSRIEKQADGVYDVTGETGEKLIDSAHPGNMHTEVTERKDDDGNLVETIVEQHEADKEVAHSQRFPKGTYSSLRALQEKLSKLGHTDVLPALEEIIKLVATQKEVLGYELTALANKLDQKGFIEAASKVDAIIKKAIGNVVRPYGVNEPPSVPAQQYEGGFQDPSALMTYPTGTPESASMPSQENLTTNQYVKRVQQPASALGAGGTPAVQRWQQRFNARHGLTAGKPGWLKPDGVWGQATQSAYEGVQSKMVQPATTGTPPPPPAAPYQLSVGLPAMPQAPGIQMPTAIPLTPAQQAQRTNQGLAEQRREMYDTIESKHNRK